MPHGNQSVVGFLGQFQHAINVRLFQSAIQV
jgi:hypothetical protein